MMSKFMKQTRGAISIFLVIVLLPMMTLASVFVDSARIQLANSMAESAGDLTLNTALTNYDSEMKNLYGLFATSQDMDELMESLEDYYRESIVAAGVDDAAADDYVGQIMDYLKTTAGSDDLMNIDLIDFEVSVPAGGNLGNPAILKSQIVEFMKYRAPLSLGTGFLDALSSMKNLSKQTALVEDKNEFYSEHQKLLTTLEEAWREIQTYQYANASVNGNKLQGFPTGTYIMDNSQDLEYCVDPLKTAVSLSVKYLQDVRYFGQLDYEIYKNPGEDAETEDDDYWQKRFGSKTLTNVSVPFTEDEPASADDILSWAKTAMSAMKAIDNSMNSDAYTYLFNLPNTADAVQEIYAVKQLNKNGANYFRAVENLLNSLVSLDSALKTCDEDQKVYYNYEEGTMDLASEGGQSLRSIAQGFVDSQLNLDQGGYFYYFQHIIQKNNGYYNEHNGNISTWNATVKNNLDKARDEAYNYYKTLSDRNNNLTNAIKKLQSVKTSLTSEDSDYQKKLAAWEKSASNMSGDTMGKNDTAEIKELKSIITVDRVNDLISRLQGAQTTLQGYLKEIEKFTLEGTKWKDIPDSSDTSKLLGMLSSAHKSTATSIVPDGAGSYDAVITEIQNGIGTTTYTQTWQDATYSDPDLTEKQVALYTWLYNNFYDPSMTYAGTTTEEKKTNSSDDDLEKLESELEGKSENTECKTDVTASTKVNRDISKYLSEGALPSTRWGDEAKAIAAGAIKTDPDEMLAESNKDSGNMLEQLLKIAGDMGTDLRDKLYVTEYIMSMFSYATIEAETFVEKTGQKWDKTPFYEKSGEEYKVKDGREEYAAEIKTLTNNSINPNMNYLYGEEIEYILYGSGGKAGVYGTIFVIRFALNTVYAFMDADINNSTLAAATALFGTPPLTPLVPFAKAAMTIGLAIAESSYDLIQLRNGAAVPLMKNSKTWVMKPSGLAGAVKDEVQAVVTQEVNKLVDKGYDVLNNALEMTNEELQALINDTENGLNTLADAAVSSVTDKLKNYANEALQKVMDLCNYANQQAMMESDFAGLGPTTEKVQLVIAELDKWLAQQSTEDPAVMEVKQAAVEYLKSNNGAVISDLFTTLEQQAKPDALATLLDEKLDLITKAIDRKVDGLINQAGSAVGEMANGLTNKLKESAAQGAESLKQTLSNEISSAFGKVPTASGGQTATSTSSTMSTLLSWTYSDYLRVFVIVGMYANEELMLLRIADLIELNMQTKNGEYALITTTEKVEVSRFFGLWKTTKEKEVTSVNDEAFSLSKSYTYLTIHATLQVKPLLMTLPFMGDTVENATTGTSWYEVEYTGSQGY